MCTRCRVTRSIDDFMRIRGTKTGPWAVCNRCSAQKKQVATNKGPTIENTTSYEPPASDDDSNQLIESDRENEELIYELCGLEGEEHSHVQFSRSSTDSIVWHAKMPESWTFREKR